MIDVTDLEWLAPLASFHFARPLWLLALPLVLLLCWRIRRPGVAAAVTYSSLDLLKEAQKRAGSRRTSRLRLVRALALTLIVLSLAQPRIEKGRDEDNTEGIDILLVLDASRSMDSQDFDFDGEKISRRAALQRVIGDFIDNRARDRIGIVAFAERPYLISPLTLDHSWMMDALAEMRTSLGTAIGSGVEAAVDLLRKSESPNKVIIAVTDGLNTSGVDPLESARTARRFGMRLYTIGVVSYQDMRTQDLDAVTLSHMARMTGGQFFQATSGESMQAIYRQIDELERREFKRSRLRSFTELFAGFAIPAFVLLLLELLAVQGRRMRFP